MPVLLLYKSVEGAVTRQHQVCAKGQISKRSPVQEILVHTGMPESELNITAWRKMVREPALLTTATSAYPTTDQIAVVRIARPVPAVPEECALPKMIWNIQIIRNAFQTKIEIMNLRNPWEIEARINRRPVRAKWRILINHHR